MIIKMSAFNLETLYPVQVNGSQTSLHTHQSKIQILSAFDDIRWRQYRVLQLQLHGRKTSLTITNEASSQWMRIVLLTISESGNIEVNVDTNLTFYTTRKDMFGLLKLKVKNTIHFERIQLAQARLYLELFLNDEFIQLENGYKDKVFSGHDAA